MIHTVTPYARTSVWPVYRSGLQVTPAAETSRLSDQGNGNGMDFSSMLSRVTPANHRNPDREIFTVPVTRMDGTSTGRVINQTI